MTHRKDITTQQELIILKKLLDNEPLKRKDFEESHTSRSANGPAFGDGETIPHSSLFERINQMIRDGVVEEEDSGEKSRRGLPIMAYYLSPIGLIRFLQLCRGTNIQKTILRKLDALPHIHYNTGKLLSTFSEDQILDTITHVCANTKIRIDYEPFAGSSASREFGFEGVTAEDLLHEKEGMIVYYVGVEFRRGRFSYDVRERIPVYGEIKKRKHVYPVSKATYKISKLISAAFFHELVSRCTNPDYLKGGYPAKGKLVVLEVVKTNPEIKSQYSILLEKIGAGVHSEEKLLENIQKLISKKSPLVRFVKKI